jgi:transcriptional regulator with XRE-family HTH domain
MGTEDVFLNEMGRRVNEKRKEMRLSQEDVAEMVDVSKQTISLIESGRQEPGAKIVAKLAKALGMSADYLLTGSRTDTDLQILDRRLKNMNERQYRFLENVITEFMALCGQG